MNKAIAAACMVALSGCATTQVEELIYIPVPYDPPYTLSASDTEICTNAAALPTTSSNRKDWVRAFLARDLDLQKCGPNHAANVEAAKEMISQREAEIVLARNRAYEIDKRKEAASSGPGVGGALFAALAGYAVAKDARRGAYMQPRAVPQAVADVEWQWDEFYAPNGYLVWMCRGVQTGMFAEEFRCLGKAKIDFFWPDKRAPF